ncbi:MAG: phosphoglycerate dehydrogenase [Eubacteriaceae bacterium]|nr:phosphoglycerate dehydrogenase [Eubacteriaceae bacterium]
MVKYTCLNPIAQCGLGLFDDKYEKVEELKDAQAALVRSAAMHDLELPDTLEAIARAGAGVNNIPLEKCAEKGIVVFNTPGANANGVKELVIAGMLLASRDIVGGIEWVKENQADENIAKTTEKAKKAFAGNEISGKKLGVIGLGAIGVKVANAACALGMKVYGYDPFVSVKAAWSMDKSVNHVLAVEDIYRECDYITIHVPLMDSTREMVNKEAIDMMKDGVVFLNFSRDSLVAEDDMVAALESGKVKNYVVDFPSTKTAGKKGCIVIPHLGASTEESEDNCAVMAVEELIDYIENGNIRNSVNYPACDAGVCTSEGRIAVLHKNIQNMISRLATVVGGAGINIAHMTNKSRGEYAYSLLDLDTPADEAVVEALNAVEGVLKVRVIK